MEYRKICENTQDMSTWELSHNHLFIKNGEAWYRDFERELPVRELMKEICRKHGSPADADTLSSEGFDDVMYDNLQFGTDELEGVFSLMYMTMVGMAEVREWLKPNDYNPNKVSKENLKLLTQSILVNGWTLPIVVRPDYTIIDGFHRWTVSGEEPLKSMLNGKVPIVVVEHSERSEDIYGTVTHNRARGTHLLEPMKAIVKELMGEGKTVEEIGKQLGMKPEEVFRLSDFSKEDFLNMMTKGVTGFSKAEYVTKI